MCEHAKQHVSTPLGAVPHRRHDGAGLRHDRRDHALLLRLHGREESRRQDRHDVSALLRAALVPVPLRLRHASRQGGVVGRRKPQAEVSRRRREYSGTFIFHICFINLNKFILGTKPIHESVHKRM